MYLNCEHTYIHTYIGTYNRILLLEWKKPVVIHHKCCKLHLALRSKIFRCKEIIFFNSGACISKTLSLRVIKYNLHFAFYDITVCTHTMFQDKTTSIVNLLSEAIFFRNEHQEQTYDTCICM
jgi:hypothetical protein